MDVLVKLLGIEEPENTSLQAAELTCRGLMPAWLAALVLLAATVGIGYLYHLEKGTMGWPRRILMAGLRVSLLALLLLLLFRPVLLAEFVGRRPRGIVLLVDNSQSMKQHDRRLTPADKLRVAIARGLVPLTVSVTGVNSPSTLPTGTPKDPARADLVRWVLQHPQLKFIEGLAAHGPVRPFLFGSTLRGTDDTSGKDRTLTERLLDGFTTDQAKTSLADAVREILERKDDIRPAAIVVVTDGQDNASKFSLQEAALECARHQVPLHIYGVGTAEGGSVQLKEVGAPDTVFALDALTVPLRWRAQGFKKAKVTITLTLGGKVVAKREVPAQTGEDLRDAVTFTVPKSKETEEDMDLVATIEVKGNASLKDSLSRRVRVIDRKIRVLYIEHSPRFVYQFLMASLLRDRRIEPTFLLIDADPRVARSGPPFVPGLPPTRARFFEAQYNVVILGDVASSYLGNEHMEWLREFVQNRGGLVVIAGRKNMPASYQNTPLAEVLPAEFEAKKFALDAEVRTQEYPATLTDAGQRSDMLFLADTPEDNVKAWAMLPGFHWQYPLTKLRPGGVSLLVNPRAKMGEQPMPLLAAQHYGKGQVLFLGSDETWRWRFNEGDKITNRFWGQIIYQLGLPSLLGQSSRRVHMALDRAQAIVDRPGSIFVRLLDKDFNPRADAKVDADLDYLDAKPGQEKSRRITLFAIPGRGGDYQASLTHSQPGRWEIRVENPETNRFQFRVELPAHHELKEAGLAEKSLRDMARTSEGKFYREESLYQLAGDIIPRTTNFTRRQEVLLWNPLMLALFLTLITGEWLLRKFSNLS